MSILKSRLDALASIKTAKKKTEHVDEFHPDAYGSDGELKPVYRPDNSWIEDDGYGYQDTQDSSQESQDDDPIGDLLPHFISNIRSYTQGTKDITKTASPKKEPNKSFSKVKKTKDRSNPYRLG